MNEREQASDFMAWANHAFMGWRFVFQNERQLQDQCEEVLKAGRWIFQREWRLDASSRPDFFIPVIQDQQVVVIPSNGIVLEVKLGSPTSEDIRQVKRYMQFPQVRRVVFLRTRHGSIPDFVEGKPLDQIAIGFNRL